MDASEHPWSVICDDNPPRIILTCNKPEERNEILKGLKKTIIFRKFKKYPHNKTDLVLECKSCKKRDAMFNVMMLGMKATGKVFDAQQKVRNHL